jgi:hypothetical protein
MLVNDPEALIAEFIAPYDDNLSVVFICDHINQNTIDKFTDHMNTTRHSLPTAKLNPISYVTTTTSNLFRGNAKEFLEPSKNSIVYFDHQIAANVINFLTNESDDELENMLIDKYLIQSPQEKYIFNLASIDDDNLAQLLQNMDAKPAAYNYIIIENYLAIWLYYQDDFSLIQDIEE